MIEFLRLILHIMASLFKPRAKLVAEILVLRQQLNVLRRQVSKRFWGAPHIHGELLKLGFTIAQSTVARYMYRGWLPSQGWRTFLTNHVDGIAAIDLFAADDNVPAALLPCDSASRTSTMGIVRGDDKSDRGVDFAPDHRDVPLGQFTSLSYSGPRHCVWRGLQAAVACHGHSGQADCSPIAVAEPVRRETDRHDPTGMSRPHDRIWGGTPAPDSGSVCRVL